MMSYNRIFKECLISISTVIIVLSFIPTLPFLLIPIYTFRQIIKYFARLINPDLCEMFSGFTGIFAGPGIHSKPKPNNRIYNTTFTSVIADADINIDKIYTVCKMVLANERFAKAKMIVVKRMGFYFWKRIHNLNLKSHFILHSEPITENDLEHFSEHEISDKPYPEDKPLWEMHLFSQLIPETNSNAPKTTSRYSAITLKYHHCLLDWLSLLDVLDEINRCLVEYDATHSASGSKNLTKRCPSWKPKNLTTQDDKYVKQQMRKINFLSSLKTFLFALQLFILGPFQLVRDLIISISTTIKHSTGIQPLGKQESFQTTVPLEYVRAIAKKNKVTTHVLTFAALSSAIRQLMIDLGVNPLPTTLSLTGPIPLPWPRPKNLTNFFTSVPLQIPIRESMDPFKRLYWAQNAFNSLKTSTQPLMFHAFFSIVGGLFCWMTEFLGSTPIGAASYTIVPGPYDLSKSLGINIKKCVIAGGMNYGNVTMLGFSSGSFSDEIVLRVTGDKALFRNPSSSKTFIDNILKEFDVLERGNLE